MNFVNLRLKIALFLCLFHAYLSAQANVSKCNPFAKISIYICKHLQTDDPLGFNLESGLGPLSSIKSSTVHSEPDPEEPVYIPI